MQLSCKPKGKEYAKILLSAIFNTSFPKKRTYLYLLINDARYYAFHDYVKHLYTSQYHGCYSYCGYGLH